MIKQHNDKADSVRVKRPEPPQGQFLQNFRILFAEIGLLCLSLPGFLASIIAIMQGRGTWTAWVLMLVCGYAWAMALLSLAVRLLSK